jgi:hypothetical protein
MIVYWVLLCVIACERVAELVVRALTAAAAPQAVTPATP